MRYLWRVSGCNVDKEFKSLSPRLRVPLREKSTNLSHLLYVSICSFLVAPRPPVLLFYWWSNSGINRDSVPRRDACFWYHTASGQTDDLLWSEDRGNVLSKPTKKCPQLLPPGVNLGHSVNAHLGHPGNLPRTDLPHDVEVHWLHASAIGANPSKFLSYTRTTFFRKRSNRLSIKLFFLSSCRAVRRLLKYIYQTIMKDNGRTLRKYLFFPHQTFYHTETIVPFFTKHFHFVERSLSN